MKGLSIEEKAKRYDEALAKAKEKYAMFKGMKQGDVLEDVFYELKENEGGKTRERLIAFLSQCKAVYGNSFKQFDIDIDEALAWLEKQGEQQSTENKGMNIDEENMTPFQKKVFCIIDSTVEEEQGLKQVCDELLALASNEIEQKSAWSEEDEVGLCDAMWAIQQARTIVKDENDMGNLWCAERWLKSLKDRVGREVNCTTTKEWSVGDEKMLTTIVDYIISDNVLGSKYIDFLKSLRPQSTWKPSEEQMEIMGYLAKYYAVGVDEPNRSIITSLYEDLKKLREE